jgi:hypothetical protein
MKSKRGGVRKKGKKGSSGWKKDPLASLNPDKNMARRLDDVKDVNEYLHKLNDEEKLWMAKFMDEYNNAKLDFKNLKNNLHNNKDLKKACTDRINARNRCIYSIENAKGMLNLAGSDVELENMYYDSNVNDSEEDTTEELLT